MKKLILTTILLGLIILLAPIFILKDYTGTKQIMNNTYEGLIGTYTIKENPQNWNETIEQIEFKKHEIIFDNTSYSFKKSNLLTKDSIHKKYYPSEETFFDETIDYTQELFIALNNTLHLKIHKIPKSDELFIIVSRSKLKPPQNKNIEDVESHFCIYTKIYHHEHKKEGK